MSFKAPSRAPGGGFGPSMGGGFGEMMDESALMQSAQQPTSASPQLPPQLAGALPDGTPGIASEQAAAEPADLVEAVVVRPIETIGKVLSSATGLDNLAGLWGTDNSPEAQAKKQQIQQRYQQLGQEQQAAADARYQELLEREQLIEQEKQQAAQRKAQATSTLQMPSSPQKGAAAAGGHKPPAVQQLEDDRKMLKGPQSAG